MKTEHWIVLGLVVWGVHRYNQSHQGQGGLDKAAATEAAAISAMDGTNFTQSLWDPVSGQPAYMFGTVPVPSGTDQYFKTMGPQLAPGSIFGHM
jgi:hypothetical protein